MSLQDLKTRLQRDGSLTISLKVIPKSSRNEITDVLEDGSLKLKVTAAPEEGKANAAVCEFLARQFDVPKQNVRIVRGETSRTKRVLLQIT
ncbi:MAG TPA: DUF167 domain-containing protein [Bryobacteraceae bacterium]|nr:DUF167 domain-containing protein [Bryobacteraceae bacterium]